MVTFQARRVARIALPAFAGVLAALAAGCSREQQDWRSAEGANTTEAWARFIEQHPDSELASQARAHLAEIAEARDWQRASHVATVAAYREFLAQHPGGARAEDARIRIEAFSLGSAPRIDVPSSAPSANASSGVPALQIATGTAAAPAAAPPASTTLAQASGVSAPAGSAGAASGLAVPGEAAQPMPASPATAAAYAAPVSSEAAAPAQAATALATSSALAEPASDGGYGVQLGAFGSAASADREWQRLQGRFGAQLGGLAPRIILTSGTAGQLYRLQVAASGEAQARAICDSLKEQAQACVPVLPQPR